jgi:hypothetical protein
MKYHKSHMNTVVVSEDTAGTVWTSFLLEKPNIQKYHYATGKAIHQSDTSYSSSTSRCAAKISARR